MGYGIRLEPRPVNIYTLILMTVLAFILAFIAGGLLMWWTGYDPIKGYSALIQGSLLSPTGLCETLVRMTPFLLIATGISISNRAGVLNIGGEGQYILGAIVTTAIGIYLADMPAPIVITLSLISAGIVGGLWGGIIGILRSKYGINEVITAVMMNWLAYRLLQWLLRGPLKDPRSEMWPMSPPLQAGLDPLIPGTRFNIGFFIALLAALIAYYVLFRTNLGFKIRATGLNPTAARYFGYDVNAVIVLSMVTSGFMAGLAGGIDVLGIYHVLYEGISIGLGYTAIITALIGRNHPIAVIPSAFLFGMIYNGVVYLQATLGVSYTLSKALEGLIYIFLLVSEVFTLYRIKIVKYG